MHFLRLFFFVAIITIFTSKTSAENIEENCVICLNSIAPPEYTHYFTCEHRAIHRNCLDEWIETKQHRVTCPICRALPLIPLIPFIDFALEEHELQVNAAEVLIQLDETESFLEILVGMDADDHDYLLRIESLHHRFDMMNQHMDRITSINIYVLSDVFLNLIENNLFEIANKFLDRGSTDGKLHLQLFCVTRRFWDCSQFINSHYRRNQSSYDIGLVAIAAIEYHMPIFNYKFMIQTYSVNLNVLDLLNALELGATDCSWRKFDVLLEYSRRRNIQFDAESWSKVIGQVVLNGHDAILTSALQLQSLSLHFVQVMLVDVTGKFDIKLEHLKSKITILNSFAYRHHHRYNM